VSAIYFCFGFVNEVKKPAYRPSEAKFNDSSRSDWMLDIYIPTWNV
jgi:hypothetical protein